MRRPSRAFFAFLLLSGCAASQQLEGRDFAIQPEPAAVAISGTLEPVIRQSKTAFLSLVVSEDTARNGTEKRTGSITEKRLTAGSGFLIDENRAITAGHVALAAGFDTEARGPDGKLYRGKVLAVRPDYDMAMVRLRNFSAGTPVRPATSACLKRGEPVFSLGKPHASGDVARVGTLEAMHFGRPVTYQEFGYPDAMVLKLATRKGESGGPLFNAKGELVGMVVSTLSDDAGKPLNLAHAVPLPALAEFICRQGDCPPAWAALRGQSTQACSG